MNTERYKEYIRKMEDEITELLFIVHRNITSIDMEDRMKLAILQDKIHDRRNNLVKEESK